MKLQRDLSGDELAMRLRAFGYKVTRQTGSHLRLTTSMEGEHHITIPKHKRLKIGTLHDILKDVADHLNISKDELINRM